MNGKQKSKKTLVKLGYVLIILITIFFLNMNMKENSMKIALMEIW